MSATREPELDEVAAGRNAEDALRSMVTGHLALKTRASSTQSAFQGMRVPPQKVVMKLT